MCQEYGSLFNIIDSCRFEIYNMVDESYCDLYINEAESVGICAAILNGYTTEWLACHLLFYTSVKEYDGLDTIDYRLVYLPDYTPEGRIPSPERVICDFIKYPNELNRDRWLYPVLKDYSEDDEVFDNWASLYEKAYEQGISKEELTYYINRMYEMEF